MKSTKLIYKYDELNTTNFHHYLDQKEHLFCIVKISNGTIIGGYTVAAFNPEGSNGRSGFIFNLNRNKSYPVRNDARLPVTNYDRFYFILGNA